MSNVPWHEEVPLRAKYRYMYCTNVLTQPRACAGVELCPGVCWPPAWLRGGMWAWTLQLCAHCPQEGTSLSPCMCWSPCIELHVANVREFTSRHLTLSQQWAYIHTYVHLTKPRFGKIWRFSDGLCGIFSRWLWSEFISYLMLSFLYKCFNGYISKVQKPAQCPES